ncbi:NUDIX domain-containing protein [Candidatus Peribacteria bacterium]|nr:NUDIX domain-containing protein [Candidatus Peribacteria bacterium]
MLSLIQDIFNAYHLIYLEESFPILEKQLQRSGEDVTSRKNFTGHVVADGCVIDVKQRKILMIYHATHKQWFCPGGHIDAEDMHPAKAARREVLEETGVKADFVLDENKEPLLLHIDSHVIPASTKKQEPEHWHHAMTFLFLADSTLPLPDIKDTGIASCTWVDIEEALQNERIRTMLSKIQLT